MTKHDETGRHPRDIAMQCAPRNMQAMHTEASNSTARNAMPMPVRYAQAVLAALLIAAGAAHAGDAPTTTVERPLDLSLARDAHARPDAPKAPGDGRIDTKPYGSGYEARGLSASKDNAATAARQASGVSIGAGASGLRGAPAGAGSGGNRSSAGRHGRR